MKAYLTSLSLSLSLFLFYLFCEAPVLGHWVVWNTPSLTLFPGQLQPGMVVAVRFLSLGY